MSKLLDNRLNPFKQDAIIKRLYFANYFNPVGRNPYLPTDYAETLKHLTGQHNQKTHGRKGLGGLISQRVKFGKLDRNEARRAIAQEILNNPKADSSEVRAAKRLLKKPDLATTNTTSGVSGTPTKPAKSLPRKRQLTNDIAKKKPTKASDLPEEYYQASVARDVDDLIELKKNDRTSYNQQVDKHRKALARAKPGSIEQRELQTLLSELQEPEIKPVVNPKSSITKAFGSDPNRTYEFKNRLIDLDDLITSNNDNGTVNPSYTQELQPRLREREASKRQVDKIAKTFVPESALWDFHKLDIGPAIIGSDLMVESGNGRTLAMRKMRDEYPQKWQDYQDKLRQNLAEAGLTEDDLKGIKNPVLVRERVSQVDRAEFAKEANSPPVLQMSALEQALVDSKMLSDESLTRFEVGEDQTIDQALRSSKNKAFVANFIGMLSDAERAPLMRGDGSLSQQGLWRIKAAVFTKLFPGEAGTRLADTFLESLDGNIKNFESAISASMPKLARADGLIAAGKRDKKLSITEDLSKSIDMLARLKEHGPDVKKYLAQGSLFGKELTPFQESLLAYFDDIGRSPKKIREFMQGYADAVLESQDSNQANMFGFDDTPTKESIVMRLIGRSVNEPALATATKAKTKRTIPPLTKKNQIPPPDSLAAALTWDKTAPKQTLDDFQKPAAGSLTIYKEAKTGRYRWLSVTSTAYQDRDKQTVSTKALHSAVEKMDIRGNHGPLRFWHVPGLDIGDCDFSYVHGRTLIESGTWRDERIPEILKEKNIPLEISAGFHHRVSEPDGDGVFHDIDIFERSLLPAGVASNHFTKFELVGG